MKEVRVIERELREQRVEDDRVPVMPVPLEIIRPILHISMPYNSKMYRKGV